MDLQVAGDEVVEISGDGDIDVRDYIDDAALESGRCGICLDEIIDRGVLDCCNDWFCFTCIDNWATITNFCPLCKSEFRLITCIPVYDAFGNTMLDKQPCSSSRDDDDWIIQEKNNALSFPSYYISEDAVKCLDGDGCKIRSGSVLSSIGEDTLFDTSIACDSCDVWYHAFCVGFYPQEQPGNSWLCPRCITDEVPQILGQKIAEMGNLAECSFSSKVSISVADEGETAVVVSMIEDQQSSEAIDNLGLANQGKVSEVNNHEKPFQECDDDVGISNFMENDSRDALCSFNALAPIDETESSNPVPGAYDHFDFKTPLDISSETAFEVNAQGTLSELPPSEVTSDQVELYNLGWENTILTKPVDEQVSPAKTPEVGEPDEADVTSNNDFVHCGGKVADYRPIRKNNTSASTKDESIKRMRDPLGKTVCEKKCKKAKVDGPSSSKQKLNFFADDSQGNIKGKVVGVEDKFPNASGMNTVSSEMMHIVKEVKKKPCNTMTNRSSEHKASGRDGSSGLRVKRIMHRAGEKSEATDLIQKLTKQIRDVVSSSPSKEFTRDTPLDNKLLAAFRASIVRPQMEIVNKVNSSNLSSSKAVLQRGKVREKLTKKIYRSNGRLRRAWDRDREIEFWKRHCLTKTKKVEALQSVLDILKGVTSPSNKQESGKNVQTSILSRIYLADASIIPRTEDIKPLSDLERSSGSTVNDQCRGKILNNSSGKDSHVVCGIKRAQETMSVHSKEEIKSLKHMDKKECLKELKSGVLTSGPIRSVSKESLPAAKMDKRKWALEILARKSVTTDRCKDQEKQDQVLLKGNFPLLAQLPMDMRPTLAPSRQSKIPLAVRQAQLNRLIELYLRKANLPVVRKTAATELAVADAINVEKEILERSKSKLVYVNLCSQHAINFQNQTNETAYAKRSILPHEDVQPLDEHVRSDPSDTDGVTEVDSLEATAEAMEVLKLTGLLSDSPPISPDRPASPKNSAEMSMRNDDIENVLDMDCNTEVDIYRDFEYDLEDEAYSVSKNLYTVPSSVQSDASRMKMKVVLSTMDSNEPGEPLEISTCGDLQATHPSKIDGSFDCSVSPETSLPVCEKVESVISPSETDAVLDLKDKEKHDESSWIEHEELYGPETKCLEENFCGTVAAKNVIPCDGGSDKLNEPSVYDIRSAKDSGSKMEGEEVSSNPPNNEVVTRKDEKSTSGDHKLAGGSVSQKVEVYIKEHIRPLCKSGIITAEQYRWAVAKTRDKVMRYHSKAKNANFLIKEGDKVKKLAQQYVEAASKSSRASRDHGL